MVEGGNNHFNFNMTAINLANDTCCCKETPSLTGWNLDIFYPHCTGINKVVFLLAMYAFLTSLCETQIICCKHASMCCVNWKVLSVEAYIAWQFFFLKTSFRWSAGKNNPDFVPAMNGVSLQQHLPCDHLF